MCRYTPSGDGYVCFSLSTTCRGSCCGIYCDSNEETIPRVGEIALVGGKGVYIDGTGIWLCRGNSSALIHRVELHSEGCETKPPLPKPPARQGRPFFVLGRLTSRVSKFLQWAEIEYYLDGYQLSNKPLSWGKVEYGDQGTRELFYISPDEVAPLEECDGYVGLWADDVLRQPWADQIFEVQVKVEESVVMRVKRSAAGDREIISDMDENARPLVPAVFAGINPWKPT